MLAALAFGAGCGDDETNARLHVTNNSDFAIQEIYVTDVGSPTWGPNLISGDLLLPGEALVLDVDCDFYDALVIAEDGAQCELHDLDLCLNHADWVLSNNTCDAFAREAARRAAERAKSAAGSAPGPAATH